MVNPFISVISYSHNILVWLIYNFSFGFSTLGYPLSNNKNSLLSSIVLLYCSLLNLFQNSLSWPIFNNKLSICIRIHTSVNENTKRHVQAPHRDIVLWFRPYRMSQFIECVIQSSDSLSEALRIFASITTQILIHCATLIINDTEIAVITISYTIVTWVFIE